MDVGNLIDKYDLDNITVGVIGSHSALEIMDGAKDEGFKTICICQKGRELPYQKFSRLADEILILNNFSDLMYTENQNKLLDLNTILVPHESFVVYLGIDNIEKSLKIPVFGNRYILKAEERHLPNNQYDLLRKAHISMPKIYSTPEEIEGPSLVKIQEAKRKLERAFFIVTSYQDYKIKSAKENRSRINK